MSESPRFTPEQARVVAALVEKSITTPAYYPMTVNGLMAACNQKSCRNPVMQLSEGEVGAALNDLEAMGYVRRDERSRSVKWSQQFRHQMLMQPDAQAVLVTLVLRGPQTLSELRANAAGLGGPDSTDAVQALLDVMMDRVDPLVTALPRAAGQKETRFAHCLCGEPDPSELPAAPSRSGSGQAALLERIEALEARVAALESAAKAD